MKKKRGKKKPSAKRSIPSKSSQKKWPKRKKTVQAKEVKRIRLQGDERKQLNKEKMRAKGYVGDKKKTLNLVSEAVKKAIRNRNALREVWDELMTLLRLVRAWAKGEYHKVPLKTIILALGAIIYLVNPFDVVPDFIPFVGYLDDVAVLAFVINSIRGDIDDFRNWEKAE